MGVWHSSPKTGLHEPLADPEALRESAAPPAGSEPPPSEQPTADMKPDAEKGPDGTAATVPGPALAGDTVLDLVAPQGPLEGWSEVHGSQLISCHIPVSCDDTTSLLFLAIADLPTACVTLLTSLTVWAFIGLFVWWLWIKVDDAVLYDSPRLELALLLIVLLLQAVPKLLENILSPLAEATDMHRFASRVHPAALRRRMHIVLAFIAADRFQPALLIGFSVYCAFFLSGGDLLSALQNAMVLSFIASLDTELQQKFLRWRFGGSARVWIVFRQMRYKGGAGGEAAFWEASRSNREEVMHTLRSEAATVGEKWQLIRRGDCGLGVLGEMAASSSSSSAAAAAAAAPAGGMRSSAAVEWVDLTVTIFSWDEVNRAVFRDGMGRPRIDLNKIDKQRLEWYLEGASDEQWAFELNSDTRTALLLECPELVIRFNLTAHDGYLRGLALTCDHLAVMAEMLVRSPVAWLDLSDNPDIGDHGTAALAEGLRHVSLTGLNLARVGMTDGGAHALLDALSANPHAVSGWLVLEGNRISEEMQDKLRQAVGSAAMAVRSRPPPPWWRWPRRPRSPSL